MNDTKFQFQDPGELFDGNLKLVLSDKQMGDPSKNWVPCYRFNMMLADHDVEFGHIDLRVGNTHHLVTYGGYFAYDVNPEHRGHHYAARACKLLLPLAHSHGLNPVWITCRPDNIASRRTCELAGAELVAIVDLPEDTDMYKRGYRQVCRYRLGA